MRLPAPLTVAEQIASALPGPLAAGLAHRCEVRRATATRPDLDAAGWEQLAAVSDGDAALRSQLVWHSLAATRLSALLHPGEDPATLAAALVAHPAEAAACLAAWDDLPAEVADLVVALAARPEDRWAAAPSAPLPTVIEVALADPDRSDTEVVGLIVAALTRRPRPPRPPDSLLRLCRDRPILALAFALTDAWLALPAVASGSVDPHAVAAALGGRRDPHAVAVAAFVAAHPDTPAEVAAALQAGPLAGQPAPWRPDPLPASWGRPDRDRDDDEHDTVAVACREAPAPWGRWVRLGLAEARDTLVRPPRWVTPPTGPLTIALGFRHGDPHPEEPTPVVDPAWPLSSLAAHPERVAPAVAWLLDEVGVEPQRWETLLALAGTFTGTVAQLAAVTPALT